MPIHTTYKMRNQAEAVNARLYLEGESQNNRRRSGLFDNCGMDDRAGHRNSIGAIKVVSQLKRSCGLAEGWPAFSITFQQRARFNIKTNPPARFPFSRYRSSVRPPL